MKIAVIIPCLNEETTVFEVVKDFKKRLKGAEVYVYDNGSEDGTIEEARRAGAKVRIVRKRGKGRVLKRAFLEVEAECFVVVDGDATYPAEVAEEMCKLVEQGADMVVGDRLSSTYDKENKRLFHGFGNRLVRWLVNRLFGGEMKDIMSGYRAFSRRFVKSFPGRYQGFEVETEMSVWALEMGMEVAEVPVRYRDRPEGSESKLRTVRDGVRVVKAILMMKICGGKKLGYGRKDGGEIHRK